MWLARRLAREEIEVTRLSQPYTALKANSYMGGAAARRIFPAGTYVVDLAQPEARLATTMLEPRAVFDSGFVRKQLAAYQRNQRRGEDDDKEGYEFYDITGWSLPLTLGLDAWWTDETTPVTGDRVRVTDSVPALPQPGRAQSAYVFADDNEAGTRLALRLLREGIRVSGATLSIIADGVSYPRGTFVVRVQRNGPELYDRISALARETGAKVTAVQSAFPDTGQYGIGSEEVVGLRVPRVLLAAGEGIDQTSFGSIWFYFERELGLPVTPINVGAIANADLSGYNTLIIPDASANRVWRELRDAGADRLKAWVHDGGAVIAIGDAVDLLARKEVGLTAITHVKGDSAGTKDTTVSDSQRPAPPIVSPSAAGGTQPEYIPGSIFRAKLDLTHWLTLGYDRDQLPVFLETSTLLRPSEKGANPVVFSGPTCCFPGGLGRGTPRSTCSNSVWAAVEIGGQGHGHPVCRRIRSTAGFWRGPSKLLTNAVLFGPNR